ncbi:molybdopterin-synthase adenylyltransferase MoeB [Capillimicrobium parvum]|uniref:Thiosulfate sulfurtransferase GlpE n=1 Tax=Capillimicrobium parvum TaxID=2884022 RepID=A0A9E6Y137_9ACTN|nr:molybdopterin-synthase adenylyltransferase MoeB [Capillimicrobium parvum]UGS37718.1 Thiosulfate sulfurtransferase GlpE [Capillimicrobium parvum]
MTPSGADYIRQIKEQISEVDPSEVHELLDEGIALLDVRESEEWDAGHLPGATHVARGYLESRIDGAIPDRSQRVVVYCASGTRSALAAKTLSDLGYANVESMTGGITLWKDRGYEVDTPRRLTAEQRERYSRHFLLPEIGQAGQEKLLDAKVLLLGAGGLGSPTALYLAAAGVGTIGIIDNDVVDLSNLQRQVIHTTDRVGVKKVDSAEESMKAINPDVNVVKYDFRMDATNIMDVITGYDVIVDGLDNFPTRYLLNDASVRLQIPVVSASILGFDGQLSIFKPYDGPCYRCLYPVPPPAELAPSCGANGVLGVLPGTMGLLQATEVIKLIVGIGEPLVGRLLLYEALGATFTELKVRRDPECPVCSRAPEDISDEEMGVFPDYEAFCAAAG